MLQVPWRDESLLIGDCSSYRERCDELKKVYPRLEASVKRALDRKHLEEETEKKVSNEHFKVAPLIRNRTASVVTNFCNRRVTYIKCKSALLCS